MTTTTTTTATAYEAVLARAGHQCQATRPDGTRCTKGARLVDAEDQGLPLPARAGLDPTGLRHDLLRAWCVACHHDARTQPTSTGSATRPAALFEEGHPV